MYRLNWEKNNAIYEDQLLGMSFETPQGWDAKMVQTPQIPSIKDELEIEKAVKNPAFGPPLRELAREKKAKTASILVSDATRAVPTARLLKYAAEELLEAGLSPENIRVFVAIGVHRPATEEEMNMFLGEYAGKIPIENHTPFEKENLLYMGHTSWGTPVWVNKRAAQCDIHIQIGKIEPHEFAGFSGGRKSVLPGISGEETILWNHRPQMLLEERAAIGVLEGNPIHEDMVEAAEKFRLDFGVNCILNNELELAAVFAGEVKASHKAGADFLKKQLGVKISRPDILVTTPGLPFDIDFYQSVKALMAVTEIVDKETVVILCCGCPEGVNSPDMLRAFGSSDDLEGVADYTAANYKIQMDHVLLISKILRKGVKIIVCCPNIADEDLKKMFMIPAHSPAEAMKKAAELTGKETGEILFYPRPQTGLPVLA